MTHLVLFHAILLFNASVSFAQDNFLSDLGYNNNQTQDVMETVDQTYGSIRGQVLDKKSKTPLGGVNIVVEGTEKGTSTDQNGKFSIPEIAAGEYTIIIDYIGYSSQKYVNVTIKSDEIFDMQIIEMEVQPIPLKEIVVSPGSYSMMGDEPTIRQTLTSEDIKIMGWAEDITRAVQRIPGTTSDEFSAQFSIRGGETDEVLVLLDGMQIYKPFHQKDFGGGLFSTVDIETIEGVDLLTGGFAAEYGDRMSGVLNMKTKTPQPGQRQTSLGFSLMNARAFSMGSFNGDKGSYLVSVRRGYLDLLNTLMQNEFKLKPSYYDLLGKVEYKLNKNHTLSIYRFLANDAYNLNEKVKEPNTTWDNIDSVDTKYGNSYGWLTLKSFLSPKLYARTILYGGSVTKKRFWKQFDLDPQAHLNSATIDDDRNFELFGIKQDWDYQVSSNLLFKLGADIKRLNVTYTYSKDILNEFITAEDSLTYQDEKFSSEMTQDGKQIGIYLSGRFKLLSPLTLETGIRYDYVSYTGDRLWSPRSSIAYSLAHATIVRVGWGKYYQPQVIDDLGIQFGDLVYRPAELAEHFVLGFEHLFQNGLHFRAEGYSKKMSHLRNEYYSFHDIDEFFTEARDDLVQLSLNKAISQGIELLLKYDTGNKFSWLLSYVLSEAKEDVAGIYYDGNLVKRTGMLHRVWDQRHTVNIDGNYRLNNKWHFNFTWKYRTGWPNTDFTVERIQREDGTYAYYHDYGVFRGSRIPSYQRLDIRINRYFFTSKGKIFVFLQVINLYNHKNIIRYDHDILEENADTYQAKIVQEIWFGLIPFMGVNWEF